MKIGLRCRLLTSLLKKRRGRQGIGKNINREKAEGQNPVGSPIGKGTDRGKAKTWSRENRQRVSMSQKQFMKQSKIYEKFTNNLARG